MARDALRVQSLEKGLRVLEAFGDDSQFLGLSEIAARTGLDKSAAQRFAHTLELAGYLEKCPKTRRYALGKKLLERSYFYLRANPLIEAATPILIELRRFSGQHVKLSLFDDTSIVYAIRQQSEREFFTASLVGRRLPIHCTAGGLAILAALSPERAAEIVSRTQRARLTPHTVTEPDDILAAVETARSKGYAVTQDQVLLGEVVVGAAITEAPGEPVAAIHIAGSSADWTSEDYERKFAGLAVETAQALGRTGSMPLRAAAQLSA